jgi:hypothetical protein
VGEALLKVLIEGIGDEQWWAAARLGRLQYAPAVDPLMDLLGDSFSRFRLVAAWALGRIGDASAADALGRSIAGAGSPSEDAAAQSLTQLGEPGLMVLARLLHDSSPSVRRVAARAAVTAKSSAADSILLDAAGRKDLVVVAEAYRYYLDRNDAALDRILADAMARHGTSDMWFALSRSTRPRLKGAAARWHGPHRVGISMGNDCLFVRDYDWQYFNYRN